MTSAIETQIPLDEARRILGVNAYSFHNFAVPECMVRTGCYGTWLQSPGISETISRDEFANALRQAEEMMENIMGYSISPRFYADEVIYPDKIIGSITPVRKTAQITKAGNKRGYLLGLGAKKQEFLGSFDIVREDYDGDGFEETGTVTISQFANIDPSEIRAYYKDQNIEIRPIQIKDTGQVRKIQFPMYLVPKWSLVYPLCEDAIDSEQPENFETEVDVYRVYLDTTDQIELVYYPGSNCNNSTDYEKTSVSTRGYVTERTLGYFNYNPGNSTEPDEVSVNYLAGYKSQAVRRPLAEVDPMFVLPTIALAVSLIDQNKKCCGDNEPEVVTKWRNDFIQAVDDVKISRIVVEGILNNLFGVTTVGAYFAYRFAENNRLFPK